MVAGPCKVARAPQDCQEEKITGQPDSTKRVKKGTYLSIYIYIYFYSKRIPKTVILLKNIFYPKKYTEYVLLKKQVILLIEENLYIPNSIHASTTHGIYECALHNKIGMFIRHCALSKVF